jgi:hypothetical protein
MRDERLKTMKKMKFYGLLTVLMVAGMLLPTASAAQRMAELGKITIPNDFELKTEIIDKGDFLLTFDDGELGLVYKLVKENLECSTGIPTDVEDSKESVEPPRVDVAVVNIEGAAYVRIRVDIGKKTYTSLLRCAKEGPAEAFPVKDWNSLDPQIRAEVDTLKEALAILDAYAGTIWPDWTEYRGLEFSLTFPNRTILVATTKERMPALYKKTTISIPGGRNVFIDNSKQIPGRLDPLMTFHGHGDYKGISIFLMGQMDTGDAKSKSKGTGKGSVVMKQRKGGVPETTEIPSRSLDPKARKLAEDEMRFSRMMMYVHEAFHVLQQLRLLEADKKGIHRNPGAMDKDFIASLSFALHSELEGEALQKALDEKDDAKALEYFKDFFVARGLKLKEMAPTAAAFDSVRTLHEGTATYSDIKAAMLIRNAGLDRRASGESKAILDALTTASTYISKETTEAMNKLKGDTLDIHQRPYIYGAYWCLLLDRFYPSWKQGLFENNRYLDEVTQDFLKLTESDRAAIAERLKTDFEYEKIKARHAKVIQVRDDAVSSIANRKGRKFLIDLKKAQMSFDINPRVFVAYGREQIYPKGLAHFRFGSLNLTSEETPMRLIMRENLLEWIDTEAEPGDKGYEIKSESREGDLYKGVTLKTRGFSMTAKAVKIKEDADKVTISIWD